MTPLNTIIENEHASEACTCDCINLYKIECECPCHDGMKETEEIIKEYNTTFTALKKYDETLSDYERGRKDERERIEMFAEELRYKDIKECNICNGCETAMDCEIVMIDKAFNRALQTLLDKIK